MNNRIPLPEWVLISALRYAMGRHTYIVSDTDYLIRRVWGSLSDETKNILHRDLGEFLDREARLEQRNYTQLDLDVWKNLYNWMERE